MVYIFCVLSLNIKFVSSIQIMKYGGRLFILIIVLYPVYEYFKI